MNAIPADPIGAAWLARAFNVHPISRPPVLSQIGGRRATTLEEGGFRLETYIETMRPTASVVGHLQFHLRHEVPHLEFLARLFAAAGTDHVQAWIAAEPTGQYARRAAFLAEWLTGVPLQVPERLGGNYVNVLDPSLQVAASPGRSVRVQRWRVNDNIAGTPAFCPTVRLTDEVLAAGGLDVPALLGELAAEFGDDTLLRAAVWMTLRESKASFAIEGEADKATRIQRFADVMARRTGEGGLPLDDAGLAGLQREILGRLTTIDRLGIRLSPVFVGQTIHFQELVHYVAPPAADVASMLDGLRVFLDRTQGQSPVMRSSVAAFAFVYIHPLADGNGRVHRFLINDILRRDGAVPDPVILPVSAVIAHDAGEMRAYHRVLDKVSKPLMERIHEHVALGGERTTYPDGVVSNLSVADDTEARPLWHYPDLSDHVVYLSTVISRTIKEQMREESRYLRRHALARAAVKEIVEMPDPQADRLLRSMEQNNGVLSNILAKEMPVLARPEVWGSITQAVAAVYREDSPDIAQTDRYRP